MSVQSNGRSSRGPRVPLMNAAPELAPAPAALSPVGTPKLDAAVLRVMANAAKLLRNQAGQVQSRTYGYVDLTAVMDDVLPLLVSETLVWKTFPTIHDGAPALRYRMTHVDSGESDEDVMPLLCDQTMQALGAGITYARRYALSAYLSLTIDYDDDGWRANTPSTVTPAVSAQPEPQVQVQVQAPQPTAAPAEPTPLTASSKQKGMLRGRASAAGLEPSAFANIILTAAGNPVRTWDNEAAAAQTLKRLIERLPWKLVDAVLAGIASA